MEYSIGIGEVIKITKQNIKIVIVLALIFALLFGAYGVKKTMQGSLSDEEKKALEIKQNNYQNWEQKRSLVQEELQDKLVKLYDVAENAPIMKVDGTNVDIITLTYSFENKQVNYRSEAFKTWVDKLSCKELFGNENELLKKYKRDYVYVYGNTGEVVVTVLKSDEFDYNKTAKKLDSILKHKAAASGVKIINSEKARVQGFNQSIVDRQDVINNNVQRIQNELNTLKSSSFENPGNPEESKGKSLIKLMIYIIAGLIAGAIIGIVIAVFKVIRKGTVLSTGQIDEFFSLQKIAEGKNSDNEYPKVVDAVLFAMDKEGGDIALAASGDSEEYIGFAEKMDAVSKRKYVFANAAEEDVAALETIRGVSNVLIPVTLGKSTYRDIQTVIKWVQKYRKNLLGYLVLE